MTQKPGSLSAAALWKFAAALIWLAAALSAHTVEGAPLPRAVLIISEADPSGGMPTRFSTALQMNLDAAVRHVAVYTENVDLSMFAEPRQEQILRTYIGQKYGNVSFGAIIAVGSAALDVVGHWRSELWPGVPIIFGAIDESTAARLRLPEDATGITMGRSLDTMVAAARVIVPGLRGVAMVGGTLSRDPYRRQYFDQIASVADDGELDVANLTGMPLAEQVRLAGLLPASYAILYTSMFSDGAGTRYSSSDSLATIVAAARQPVIVDVESLIGTGAIGGYVLNNMEYGREVAQVTLRVLDGTPVGDLPVSVSAASHLVFDSRQLARRGVQEGWLPTGTSVLFDQQTLLETHPLEVAMAVAAVLAQTGIIAFLLVQMSRRRRAETSLRMSRARTSLTERRLHLTQRRYGRVVEELAQHLISAQDDERRRIASELHDSTAQHLVAIKLYLGHLENQLKRTSDSNQVLSKMRESLDIALRELRAFTYLLYPPELERQGLVATVKGYVKGFSGRTGLPVGIEQSGPIDDLPHAVQVSALRIVQEALGNVHRHAGASQVQVSLARKAGLFTIQVRDNGRGMDPLHGNMAGGNGVGIVGMRARAQQFGGDLRIIHEPPGTLVMAVIPVEVEKRRIPRLASLH